MYLISFNRSLPPSRRDYEEVFKDLRGAQQSLASYGIPLLFVLNPNVLMLYPEVLPAKYQAIRPGPRGYDWALELIEKHAVVTIDTFA